MPYPAQKAERSAKAPSGSHIGRVWSVAYDSHRVSGEDRRRVRVALQHEDASCIAIPPQNKTRRLSIRCASHLIVHHDPEKRCRLRSLQVGSPVPTRRVGWVTSDINSILRMSLWGGDTRRPVQDWVLCCTSRGAHTQILPPRCDVPDMFAPNGPTQQALRGSNHRGAYH